MGSDCMTMSASIELFFGDKKYTFRLVLGELQELESVSGKGVFAIFRALSSMDATTDMIRHVIRLGLIGGGLKPQPAADLVRRYVDERPDWYLNAQLAYGILGAALTGPDIEGETPEKKRQEKPRYRIPWVLRKSSGMLH